MSTTCSLPTDEIHVWQSRIGWSSECIRELGTILSPDERKRADAFYLEIDRRRLVVGRGLLRLILAHVLDRKPVDVRFEYNEFGKPSLSTGPSRSCLQFNVSHSGDVVLLALAVGRAVGIDVEKLRIGLAVDEIAKHYFSARERTELATLNSDLRFNAFFTCWTRKEAFIKARGEGLSMPLDEFDVSLLPGQPARLLATRPDPTESARWDLQDVDVGCGSKAAIAVEGSGWHIKRWHWPADCLSPNDLFARPLTSIAAGGPVA